MDTQRDVMTDQKSIFFIGGGNMAAAIIGGMNQKEWKITVAEVYEEARKVYNFFRVDSLSS